LRRLDALPRCCAAALLRCRAAALPRCCAAALLRRRRPHFAHFTPLARDRSRRGGAEPDLDPDYTSAETSNISGLRSLVPPTSSGC
jgi:hypothetical protein